jgi:hypothetical protein
MSPIESAIHDKSILTGGISTHDRAAAPVMMMMSVRPNVGGGGRNRHSAKDACYGRDNHKLIHDLTPP